MTDQTSPLRVQFSGMAYGGDAVGRDPDGRAVFAWPGIEGETADVAITEARNTFSRGLVVAIEEPSPSRVMPPCPYFGSCGGCQWQHIDYQAQLRFKSEILASQLSRIGGIADPGAVLRPPIGSPVEFGYRNSSHFAVDPLSGKVAYFRRDTHSLIPVDECPISNAGINAAIPLVNSVIASTRVPVEQEDARGLLRLWKVTIRFSEAAGQTVVIFHSRLPRTAKGAMPRKKGRGTTQAAPIERPDGGPSAEPSPEASPAIVLQRREVRRALAALADRLAATQPLVIIEVMEDGTTNALGETRAASSGGVEAHADAVSGSLLGPGRREQEPAERLPLGAWVEQLGGRHYWIPPLAFFQVNTAAAELMLAEVREHMPATVGLLLDAHAGVGTFAAAFARTAARVIAFEVDSSAVLGARWTARAHQFSNVEFRVGKAEALVTRLRSDEQPDVVVLDPPRSGCHPALLAELARRKVPRIIYVSCDPSTLARDVKLLSNTYELASARALDMFPQTYHIETVARLDLKV
ncbi:MAG TPA: class I SAM-dependent RNA methyltransferase [Chloroflexia bacterium]|nr:class I SAM-dependent RNA methyltransferase [Chloroflexia bacterium]